MLTPARPSAYFHLSLLGHRIADVLCGVRGGALAKAPLLRYVLVATLAIAIAQGSSAKHERASATDLQTATAGLFGSGTSTALADGTATELAAIDNYRSAIARLTRDLALERSALTAATLLRARGGSDVDVDALAAELADAAHARGAFTGKGWVAAAATLFDDVARAEADLHYLIRRYGL